AGATGTSSWRQSIPCEASMAVMPGNSSISCGMWRASSHTFSVCSCRARHTPVATTSRGASSARGSTSARKRWPSSSSSTPPAPRTASEMRKFVPARTVGWNWTNSISANTAPARAAARIPAPVHTPPLVERGKIPLYPPVAGGGQAPGTRPHPTAGGAGEAPAVPAGGDDGRIRTEVYRFPRAPHLSTRDHAIGCEQFGQLAAGVLGDPTTLRATAALARLRLNLLCDLFREEGVQGRAGAITPRVDDPLRAMRRLQRERGRAVREQVGGETGREQAAHRHRALGGQKLDRPGLLIARRDQPRPRSQGVIHVRGHAIGRVDRGGDPTLCELRGSPAGS